MTDHNKPTGTQAGDVIEDTEAQMRRALDRLGRNAGREGRKAGPNPSSVFTQGARAPGDASKRRFVREGEVPVMMVSNRGEAPAQRRGSGPIGEQLAATEAALRTERENHAATARELRDARDAITELKTKLGKLSMARDEALDAARRAETARATLAAENDALNLRLANEVAARARAERHAEAQGYMPEPPPAPPAAAAPAAKRRGRPPRTAASADGAATDGAEGTRPARVPKAARPPALLPDGSPAPKRKPGRPPKQRDPEPVKWWMPKRGGRG